MGFTGTLEKCKACGKTVHFVEMLTADGIVYHKTCFKCTHCNDLLQMRSYSSLDGTLYCKPHFEQRLRESDNFSKTLQNGKTEKPNKLSKSHIKFSSLFSGTQDKCAVCKKTAYPLEKVSVEGEFYHKSCFRCHHGGCFLTPSTYAALDGILYCKIHFAQLFKEKGCYNHLTKIASVKKLSQQNSDEESKVDQSQEKAQLQS